MQSESYTVLKCAIALCSILRHTHDSHVCGVQAASTLGSILAEARSVWANQENMYSSVRL